MIFKILQNKSTFKRFEFKQPEIILSIRSLYNYLLAYNSPGNEFYAKIKDTEYT